MTGESSNTHTDKPFGITNIKAYVPLTLDLDELNYDAWRELFETHCISFGVLDHLENPAPANPTPEWSKLDSLVKLWIYGTISKPLLLMILKKKVTTNDVWKSLENLFRDNKDARGMQLDNELRNIEIGDMSITDYCQKIKVLSDLLANIDQPVPEKNLVTYMINGLGEKYDQLVGIIRHKSRLPSFLKARSMLLLEETRLSRPRNPNVVTTTPPRDSASSPSVLHAGPNNQSHAAPPPPPRDNRTGGGGYQGRGNGNRNRGRGNGNYLWGYWGAPPYWGPPPPWARQQPPRAA